MILTSEQIRPGPHWCRLSREQDWFIIQIERTDMLGYGLAGAEFVPIHRPLNIVDLENIKASGY